MISDRIFLEAEAAKKQAYCPYSKFPVGCSVLGKDGRIFIGCNLENCAYPLSNCAERNAVASAVVNGCRELQMVVVTTDTDRVVWPCGGCRQVLNEFCDRDTLVVAVARDGTRHQKTMGDLLPGAFDNTYLSSEHSRRDK